MQRVNTFFILILLAPSIFSQKFVTPEYFQFKTKGDSLFYIKKFKEAGIYFNKAFKEMGNKSLPEDRYRAATCWALAGFTDSSFRHLYLLTKITNFSDYKILTEDKNFQRLHQDSRWKGVINNTKNNLKKIEEKLDQKLISLIDSMLLEDQKWRGLLRELENGNTDETNYSKNAISRKITVTDSLNYFFCKKIIDKYGFPNYEIVGIESSNNYCILVIHQDGHPFFQDSVLKKMKIQVEKELASIVNYAYLVDRVKVNMNEKQIYGTQMTLNKDSTSYIPKPVINESELDRRRKSVGLDPIEDYIKTMNKRYPGTLKR